MPKVSEMLDDDDDVIDLVPNNVTTMAKGDLQTEAVTWAAKSAALVIRDRESYINASHFLRSLKSVRADIQHWFAPHIDAAMETKRKAEAARKTLADERDKMEAPLIAAEGKVKHALIAWDGEQERLRLEQERALQIEAQRQAEALVVSTAAAMEREAIATGNAELLHEAQDIIAQPVEAPAVKVEKLMPKMQGITYRDAWKAHDVVDVKALARAIADGLASPNLLLANMPALNALARATQGTQPVPGVRFYNDRQVVARP